MARGRSGIHGIAATLSDIRLSLDLVFLVGRFIGGRSLDGRRRTDATWWRAGRHAVTEDGAPNPGAYASRWALWPGWRRTAVRLGTVPALVALVAAYVLNPRGVQLAAALVAVGLVGWAVRRVRDGWADRRHQDLYVQPLAATVAGIVGLGGTIRGAGWCHVSPDLGTLAARLVRPMSPAETAVRAWYGEHLEPILRWTPDRIRRVGWWLGAHTEPARALVRRPVDQDDRPRVALDLPVPYVTAEVQRAVSVAVATKLGLPSGDLREEWDMVGWTTHATWTLVERAPQQVTLADIAGYIDTIEEYEYILGLGANHTPIKISLDDDSPHIACSAGSGAGKSVLAMLLGVQTLRRGGKVIILDRKGSHRWAKDLPGVVYCTKPAQMHAALIELEEIANDRNDRAMNEEEGWNPGPRYLVIFEEMNATVAMLKAYWEQIKEKGDPKTSPAIQAFRNLMYMGRSAKCNLFGVAQMLTANTTGGPEARENFGIRCLARFTANNWKMLAPECRMPRKSKVRGRWQIVVAGESKECQVAYLHDHEARALATGALVERASQPVVPVTPVSRTSGSDQGSPDAVPQQRPAFPPRRYPPSYRHAPTDSNSPTSGAPDTGKGVPTPENGAQSDSATGSPADPLAEEITLVEARQRGILVGTDEAIKKRLQRARRGIRPRSVGTRGKANLYRVGDLVEFAEHTTKPRV